MRYYLVAIAVVGSLVLVLLTPGLLLMASYLTFGLAFVGAQVLLNLFAAMIILLPAVWFAKKSSFGAAAMGVALLSFAVYGPVYLREPSKQSQYFLQPPLAPPVDVATKSVELKVSRFGRTVYLPCSGPCLGILQNPELNWVRLRPEQGATKLYVRGPNGLTLQSDHGHPADLIVSDYDNGAVGPKPSIFSLWVLASRPQGYVVKDTRSNQIVARNISAKMLGVSNRAHLFLDVDAFSGETSLSVRRTEAASVAEDPTRSLEGDLDVIGLLNTEAVNVPTINTPEVLDAAVGRILAQSGTDQTRPLYTEQERPIISEFIFQVSKNVSLEDRQQLILELLTDRRHLGGEDVGTLLAAHSSGRQQLSKYAAKSIGDSRVFRTISDRLRDWSNSSNYMFYKEIGRYSTEISDAFRDAEPDEKVNILSLLPLLELEEPELILNQIIEPFPPANSESYKFSAEFNQAWRSKVPDLEFLRMYWETAGHFTELRDDLRVADKAITVMGKIDGLENKFVRDWVLRWSLERDIPSQYPKKLSEAAMKLLSQHNNPETLGLLQYYLIENW